MLLVFHLMHSYHRKVLEQSIQSLFCYNAFASVGWKWSIRGEDESEILGICLCSSAFGHVPHLSVSNVSALEAISYTRILGSYFASIDELTDEVTGTLFGVFTFIAESTQLCHRQLASQSGNPSGVFGITCRHPTV